MPAESSPHPSPARKPDGLTQDNSFRNGVVVTTGTTAVVGKFCAVQVLEAATFSAWSEEGASGNVMTGFAIPAGTILHGRITGYTLTSGKVRAYRANY